jgi:uncharacterized repeat protein (TIGR03803 family)
MISFANKAARALLICAHLIFFALVSRSQSLETLYDFKLGPSSPNGLFLSTDGSFYGTTPFGGAYGYGTVFKITPEGLVTTLCSFKDGLPNGGLVQAPDGVLYGSTHSGGKYHAGTIFRVTKSGTLTTFTTFNGANGLSPTWPPVIASDGNFYGTTVRGGATDQGAFYKITPSGEHTLLFSFNSTTGLPYSDLLEASDGAFYGRTGFVGLGIFYRMSKAGKLTTLFSFQSTNIAANGSLLIQARNGSFYGACQSVGSTNLHGAIFKFDLSGVSAPLIFFDGTNGSSPSAKLVEAADGTFYGTTRFGGTYGKGTVFRITPAGDFSSLLSFDGRNGIGPSAIVQSSDGTVYGVAGGGGDSGIGTFFEMTAAGEVKNVVSFGNFDGAFPSPGLVQASDGTLYGTATKGGRFDNGTIFKLSPSGAFSTFLSFDNGLTRGTPSSLAIGGDGNLYGSTSLGSSGDGLAFKVTPSGILSALHSFGFSDGHYPSGPLTLGSDGFFYGITSDGGGPAFPPFYWAGTAFRMSTLGDFSTLFPFDCRIVCSPSGPLIQSQNGNFYGTTAKGGPYDAGTIFQISKSGLFSVLAFFDRTNGYHPEAPLTAGPDDNLFGITTSGGKYGYGTLFKLAPSGDLSTLASFNRTNGSNPTGGLLLSKDGYLYGTTSSGLGTSSDQLEYGTIFKADTSGFLTTLFVFSGTNGMYPQGNLMEGLDGNLYGTTFRGSSDLNTLNNEFGEPSVGYGGGGTIFRLNRHSPATTITLSVRSVGEAVTFGWNSTPGRIYRAQFKDNLAASSWTDLLPTLSITATSIIITNQITPSGNRFYRVLLEE